MMHKAKQVEKTSYFFYIQTKEHIRSAKRTNAREYTGCIEQVLRGRKTKKSEGKQKTTPFLERNPTNQQN